MSFPLSQRRHCKEEASPSKQTIRKPRKVKRLTADGSTVKEVVKQRWSNLQKLDVDTRYIEPGAPCQNGFIESTGSRLRDELLDRELCTTRLEAEVLCEQYRRFYDEERPHSAPIAPLTTKHHQLMLLNVNEQLLLNRHWH